MFDVVVSGIALIVTLPVSLVVAVLVLVLEGRPVIFRQERVGRNGEHFHILKFRSMRSNAEGSHLTMSGDERITKLGRVLRHTKLDELPQLVNVLIGTMSLVGPRPEVAKNVTRWPKADRDIILSARPGLTSPATIAYRLEQRHLATVEGDHEEYYFDVIMPRKVAMNVDYVRNRTFLGDLLLIARTIRAVVAPSPYDSSAPPGGTVV